jgi:hypothetical protein
MIIILLSLLFIFACTIVVKRGEAVVIERMGKFHKVLATAGIHVIIPFLDRPIFVNWAPVQLPEIWGKEGRRLITSRVPFRKEIAMQLKMEECVMKEGGR